MSVVAQTLLYRKSFNPMKDVFENDSREQGGGAGKEVVHVPIGDELP